MMLAHAVKTTWRGAVAPGTGGEDSGVAAAAVMPANAPAQTRTKDTAVAGTSAAPDDTRASTQACTRARDGRPGTAPGRRRFLAVSAGAAVVAAAGGGIGDLMLRRFNVTASRAQVHLPAAAKTAAPVPAGTGLQVSGISPFYTPNSSFYRVDTELGVPQVPPDRWTLRIHGMVERRSTSPSPTC